MARRRNAADDRLAARPEGVTQAVRFRVTALGNGTTIPFASCLDPNRLCDSAYGFLYEGISEFEEISDPARFSITGSVFLIIVPLPR